MSRTKIVMAAFAALVAGTLLIVYAQWGEDVYAQWGEDASRAAVQSGPDISPAAEADRLRAIAASEAAKTEGLPAKPESDAPKSEGSGATPPAPPGAQAPPPGTPEVIYDFNRLPDEIRDTLQSIVVAAQSGNIDD